MNKLTNLQLNILDTLGQVLFGYPAECHIDDYDAFYSEALAQAVLPLVFRAPAAPYWEKLYAKILSQNITVDYEHAELHSLFSANSTPYVAIKGSAAAAYYPNPMLRMMGDVDFIVGKADLSVAGQTLEKAGFSQTGKQESGYHIAFLSPGHIEWEMHWAIWGAAEGACGEKINQYMSRAVDTAQLVTTEDGCFMAPDAFHHGLVLLVHTAGHMVNSGVGLRHLCDWAVFANAVDVGQWETQLKECGLWRFAQLLTQVSIRYLHLPEKAWAMENVDDTLLESIIADILAGGNLGKKDKQRLNQAKLITSGSSGKSGGGSKSHRLIRLFTYKAQNAMPICKKYTVLLPIGWIYVGSRHLFRIARGTRPNINLKETVQGAEERQAIYKEFHLYEENR